MNKKENGFEGMVNRYILPAMDFIFPVIVCILVVMSLLVLVSIHIRLVRLGCHSFEFTPTGINNYLNEFSHYKSLLTGTVATCAAYYGILRLKAATDANCDKLRQDRFTEFKTVMESRLADIEKKDPYLKKEYIRLRLALFNQLFPLGFSIQTRDDLKHIIDTVFGTQIRYFEMFNKNYIGMGGVYMDQYYAYSLDSFRVVLYSVVNELYPGIAKDLQLIYSEYLDPARNIDPAGYRTALLAYTPIV